MGKTRNDRDAEIFEYMMLKPLAIKKGKKEESAPHTAPHTASEAAPLTEKGKVKDIFSVYLGQKVKRFTGRLVRLSGRFPYEQIEMIESLSKVLGVSKSAVLRYAVFYLYSVMKSMPFR